MASKGRRYPLLIYRHMLNRWWPPVIVLGIILSGTVGAAWLAEWYFPPFQNPIPKIPTTPGAILLGLGGATIAIGVVMLLMRSAAFVQPFEGHLRVSTPFLRFNISYKRFLRTYTASMVSLFPPKSLPGWRREIIAPLASKTAVVVELRGFPMQPNVLRTLLSPFFFKDKTPHIVLLVNDWLRFSTELESYRSGGIQSDSTPKTRRRAGLLSNLNDSHK
jgi:hypothetical protein